MTLTLLQWECPICKAVTKAPADLNGTGYFSSINDRRPLRLFATCHHCNTPMVKALLLPEFRKLAKAGDVIHPEAVGG